MRYIIKLILRRIPLDNMFLKKGLKLGNSHYEIVIDRREAITKAINMAKYSPSACNRQYIKVHYYPQGKMRRNVINYSLGKGGIYFVI